VRGGTWLLAVLALGAATAPAAEESPSPNQAAWQAFQRRDFQGCERLATEGWKRAEADHDSLQAALAAANLAAAVAVRGQLDEGLEWSRRAEQALGPEREPRVRGRILVAQGLLRQARGEEEESAQAFVRAQVALGADDWPLAFAETLAKAYDWEDLNAAFQRMNGLRDAARISKEPDRAALALLVLGWLEGVGGSPEAVTKFEEARSILVSRNQSAVLPLIDHNIGSVHLWLDHLSEAQVAFERGLAEARAASDRRMEVILLDDLGMLFSQKEDWPRAIASDREAGERLAAILEDVKQGRLEDSLLLDLRRLVKGRYVHKPQMLIDLFLGLFDQLAVEPQTSGK